ncbi:MAG: ABC transporter permease subunit [Clostridiales bacterium]|jgi:ABC-type polysaccharide transport system permease subunit|nr:ABC transporter permease subunit [Clostridiales bacterium]
MLISEPDRFLERERGDRKQGAICIAFISLAVLALSSPFVQWINIVNAGALYDSLKLKKSVTEALLGGYSLFNILSFVQDTKQGAIGIYAMVLLLTLTAALVFHAITIVKIIFKAYGEKGLLSFYTSAQAAMILSLAAGVGSICYIAFANNHFKMTGFSASIFPYAVSILSLAAVTVVKVMDRRERTLQKEHGFFTEFRKNWILFIFLIPSFVYFLINNYLPMAGIYFAFTQFNFRDGLFASPYVGFKNFEFLVMADLYRLTRNTVLYNLVFIGLGNVLQIIFAILVSRVGVRWFKKTSQTLIFMPYFVSFVILKVLVYNILEYNYGVINTYIAASGGQRVDFYNTPGDWPLLITLFYIWKNIGYGMVVYLATIMGINDEYYDAAKVDGANIYQQIRYITLPHLKPTFIIMLLYALGSIMKGQFELFYQLVGSNGALFNVTDIFDTYVYRITTTQPLSMGLGAAAGLYQSLFGFLIIMAANFIIKRKSAEYALF